MKSLSFLPRFWTGLGLAPLAMLLLVASNHKYAYVHIPDEPPSLVKDREGREVYEQRIVVKEEHFADRPIFILAGVATLAVAGFNLVKGVSKDGSPTPSTPRPAPLPATPVMEPPKKAVGRVISPTRTSPPPPPKVEKPVLEPDLELEETLLDIFPVEELPPPEEVFPEDEDWLTPATFAGFELPKEEPEAWIERFIRQRHVRIAGLPGSGKSYLSIRLLQEDIQAGAKIAICDRHYLKPLRDRKTGAILLNEDGTPKLSDWNGFPRTSIFCTQADIARVITDFRQELKERQRICRTCPPGDPELKRVINPWFLYFDELDATLTDFKNAGNTKILDDLGILISEGDGFSIGVRLIGQSLACGKSQIDEATNGQLCVVMLGRTAVNPSEVGKLKLGKSESDSLIAQVKAINDAGNWGAIVQFKSDPPEAVSIPDLSDLDKYRFDEESPCPIDSVATQQNSTVQAHREKQVEEVLL